jgi:hypothetical protein
LDIEIKKQEIEAEKVRVEEISNQIIYIAIGSGIVVCFGCTGLALYCFFERRKRRIELEERK